MASRIQRAMNPQGTNELGYQHTLMYGRYSKELGEFAKEEGAKARVKERIRRREERFTPGFKPYKGRCHSKCFDAFCMFWRYTFAKVGEDWVFLALLGISMALVSFAMDYAIAMCQRARLWLYKDLATHPALQYVAWVSFPTVLILFSSGFTHIVAPQAIGSGIPEMKTVLRGVVLKEYLTFRALVSKVVGLTSSLGSGLPLGKEGPFVHISSIMGSLLSKLFTSFKGIYENESRSHEMLAAACAVGVSCCFAAPVGGVMFSIEVTSVYFAVRNYWRGFFAAVCGAMVFRLLAVWFKDEETITALFKTNFRLEIPFDPQELFVFALIGVFSGFAGALFVWLHRKYVVWMRKNKKINFFLQKNRFLYPGLLTIFISSVTFPLGLGQFMATEITNHEQVTELFSNFSWAVGEHDIDEERVIKNWATPYSNIFITLTIYVLVTFLTTILACTIPVPSGIFIPHFKMGAAFGRLVGELMALWFPEGVRYGSTLSRIMPGGYAVVGAAAWAGAVTHTVSTSVIVFELTGQISHILPVMIAVLVSNAVSQALQPSIYDSIIMIKKLPYLPDILSASSDAYNIYVEDIMVTDVKYIWLGATYRDVKFLLESAKRLRSFPLVDSPESMILLGSVQRVELITLLAKQLGRERRLQLAARKAKQESVNFQLEQDTNELNLSRRPSRFEVTPAPDILETGLPVPSVATLTVPTEIASTATDSQESGGGDKKHNRLISSMRSPKKSILKKANSFSSHYSPAISPMGTPYSTVTSQDSRLRMAFEAIFKKTHLQDMEEGKVEGNPKSVKFSHFVPETIPESVSETAPETVSPQIEEKRDAYSPQNTITSQKKVQLPKERIIDMSPEEQLAWEEEQFNSVISFDRCRIDPAPFQLVERTSLLKVHSLFSLLGLNHAYVTALGRLVGVVALKELRTAIEGTNSGSIQKPSEEAMREAEASKVDSAGPSHIQYVSTVTSVSSMASSCTVESESDYTSVSQL